MEKNINIAELLKGCPKGMELYSPLCGECYFDRLHMGTIICKKQNTQEITFTSEGYYMLPVFDDCECVLFPSKECRDWSKFQRPFKDGDIVFYNDTIAIFKEWGGETLFRTYVTKYLYCDSFIDVNVPLFGKGVRKEVRFATEEEKEKFFQSIKDNGYEWNSETKTLEELSVPSTTEKFYIRIGDISSNEKSKIYKGDSAIGEEDGVSVYNCIKLNNIYHIVMPLPLKEGQGITYENLIQEITQCRYEIENPRKVYLVSGMEVGKGNDNEPLIKNVKILKDLTGQFNTQNDSTEETKTLEKLVEPKFKVGDIITKRDSIENSWVVSSVSSEYYGLQLPKGSEGIGTLPIIDQDKYDLVPNKFDITTLKPFKSEVLVRDTNTDKWRGAFYSYYNSKKFYTIGSSHYYQCIPYKGNEYLLGTTDDCDEYYKNW